MLSSLPNLIFFQDIRSVLMKIHGKLEYPSLFKVLLHLYLLKSFWATSGIIALYFNAVLNFHAELFSFVNLDVTLRPMRHLWKRI